MLQNRILIVDDDDVTRKILTRLLRKEGFHVSTANTGGAGLTLLSKTPCDLVMTDLVMEDVNGLKLLTRVKRQFPDIEVILITGYASIPTAIEAVKKGAYHYLEKPIRPDEMIHLARQAIAYSKGDFFYQGIIFFYKSISGGHFALLRFIRPVLIIGHSGLRGPFCQKLTQKKLHGSFGLHYFFALENFVR